MNRFDAIAEERLRDARAAPEELEQRGRASEQELADARDRIETWSNPTRLAELRALHDAGTPV